jgi:hypothetical protein
MRNLRLLVWTYFFLLIFEGALRKWIVPALDAPLLIIRDPLVVWIYYEAYRNRLFFNNAFFIPTLVLAFFTALFSTLFGEGNLFITVYGIHADYLQIPLIFLLPQIFHRDDVIAMGKVILYISIFMAALCIYQFRSPQDSFINKGAMNTWYLTVRPSGTFSFVSGPVAFFPLAVAFIYLGFLRARTYPFWLLVASSVAIMLAAACSGSRSVLISIGIVTAMAILCVLLRGKGIGGMFAAAIVMVILLQVLSMLPVFQDGIDQLNRRFKDAAFSGEDTSGMVNRYANTMEGPIANLSRSTLFGHGLGLGTNAAAGLLTGGREFLGSEDEWGRLIFESGPIFGLLLVAYRVALGFVVGKCAYDALFRDNILPALIFSACGLLVINGQWGVPTSLGFAVFGAGLTLAACEEPADDEEEYEDEDGEVDHHNDHAGEESDHSPAGDKVA